MTIKYWLQLHYTPNLGGARAKVLLEHFGNIHSIMQADPALMRTIIGPTATTHWQAAKSARSIQTLIEKDLQWAAQNQCTILPLSHPDYPTSLREIHSPPILLYAKGRHELLKKPNFAIIGSRHPSLFGKQQAFSFAQALSSSYQIVSGLAEGIDTYAHLGSLQQQQHTIAVLGSGVEHIYPPSNQNLASQILEHNGVLLSEYPPHSPARAKHFPMRNRIISGLSIGCLVVEAALKSGSLITAKHALEQGREIFAMPGSLEEGLSSGCHQLIKLGAKLTESPADIFEELALHSPRHTHKQQMSFFDCETP